LKYEIDLDILNKDNKTAFDLAHENGFLSCCLLLQNYSRRFGSHDLNSLEDSDPEYDYCNTNSQCITSSIYFKEVFIHIDLKGAPPKPSYFSKLFQSLSKFHVTG
jgi:hypothetical protein